MGVQYDPQRRKFVVRWHEDGRKRCRRFATETEAAEFDASLARLRGRPANPDLAGHVAKLERRLAEARGEGVYAYETRAGLRWRVVFRQSDGTISSRRGFTSRRAAVAARRRLIESVDRGEVTVSRETFETFWNRFLADRGAYMTRGSHTDLATHGRKRLVPCFGGLPLSKINEDHVRDWLGLMVELVDAGDLSSKTVNNARTCLSVALNDAVRRGLMPRNPCASVPALPLERGEIEYLRWRRSNRTSTDVPATTGNWRSS